MVQLFVKGLKGETYAFDIEEDDNVLEITKQFSKKVGIPVEQIRLIFTGKQLEDGKTLREYKIGKESIIMSVLRIRGGLRDQTGIVSESSIIPDFT